MQDNEGGQELLNRQERVGAAESRERESLPSPVLWTRNRAASGEFEKIQWNLITLFSVENICLF